MASRKLAANFVLDDLSEISPVKDGNHVSVSSTADFSEEDNCSLREIGQSMIGQPPSKVQLGKRTKPLEASKNADNDYIPSSDSEDENLSQNESADTQSAEIDESASRSKLRRWRRRNPENSKKSRIKHARSTGQEFVDEKGKLRKAREIKTAESHKHNRSKYQCCDFTSEERKAIFDTYWQKGSDFKGKKNFLLQYTKKTKVERRKVVSEEEPKKKETYGYFFPRSNEILPVCRDFFCKTLCISYKPIALAHNSKSAINDYSSEDKRGKHPPANKLPTEVLLAIKNHIESFPCIESHYCRKSSKKRYLDSHLNVTKMFELYKELVKGTPSEKVSFQKYQEVFGTEYNLAFFKPRKDQCVQCSIFQNMAENDPTRTQTEEEYNAHLARKESCRAAMQADIALMETDPELIVATIDLQSVLQIPQSAESAFYYKRKLCMYNLTVYVENSKEGYCFIWSEIEGKRGSCEVGSCLLNFVSEQATLGKKKIKIWSDNCGGQNRNKFVAAMLLQAVQELPVEYIEQNYLERGHTQMSVDSMHSSIETAAKNVSMYSVNDWSNVMKAARRKNPYKVIRMKFSDFKDLKEVHSDIMKNGTVSEDGDKVNWLKIKCLNFSKSEPGKILFKYSHQDQFKVINAVGRRKRGRPIGVSYQWPDLYKKQLCIAEAKKADLISLCKLRLIPEELHLWFQSLATSKKDATIEFEDSGDE